MSLKYNILWLDDRIDDYKKLEIDIDLKNYIENLFLEPNIYMYETIEEAERHLKAKKYDVIFSDYNINENKDGRDFIIELRKQNVNAEVLFYSAQQTPPETGVDRISFLRLQSTTSYEDLKRKMFSVIDLTVEKINNLVNLRGLVMSEVSELDVMMKEIVVDFCNQNTTDEEELRKYIIGKLEERLKNSLDTSQSNCDKNCFHKWKNKTVQEVVFERNFESYTTARALNHIIEKKKIGFPKFLDTYSSEIIQNRNELAHCITKYNAEGVEILVTKTGDKEFSEDDIRDIRKNIIKYHQLFKKLLDNV